MGVIANRKQAIKSLNSIVANRNETFSVHYSQKSLNLVTDEISAMVIAIVVRSFDNSINETFGIHLEADLLGYTIYDIADLFPELELSMLKKFNDFTKKYADHTWIHWDMISQDFGFQAIKHRYTKLAGDKLSKDFHEIPVNRKINLHRIFENIYGNKFVTDQDKFRGLCKLNHEGIVDHNYLSLSQESDEFDKGNYKSITDSLHCKTDGFCYLTDKLINKRIRVQNKNFYSVFLDFITHPIFNLIGWIATIIGFVLSLYLLFH